MQGISWSLCVFVIIALCHQTFGAPNSVRVKRDDELQFNDQSSDLNPIEAEESLNDGLDREKRKLPDAVFDSKNAVLGFVFGKIDNLIDTKTRFVERLDRTNIEKNKLFNITSPPAINDIQTLITAVVSPKINSISQVLSTLTTGVIGGLSGGAGANGQAGGGLGDIVSKFLRFSGPLLQSNGGGSTAAPASDEAGY